MTKDANDPSQTSAAHDVMAPRLAKMRAVLGGTETMREAGQAYLPQHDKESSAAYLERLDRSVLYNVTDMTLKSWVGQVFANDLQQSPSLSAEITNSFEDIDLQGNNIDVFAREWFQDGVSYGIAPMLVLFPPTTAETTEPRTKKDDVLEARRPYWRRVAAENVLDARTAVRSDGREVYDHVRILEGRVEVDGFSETWVEQILVYTDTDVTTYELNKQDKRRKKEWVQTDRYEHDLGEVPLVVFYAEKQANMVGRSSLMDLADVNIQHWQSDSDQTACLTVSRFPILAATGVPEETELVVGPRKFLRSDNENAKFSYVEHSGSALAAGATNLRDLEARMSNYGAEFLKRRPGRETATARALDSSEATSQIEDVAKRYNDALDTALYFTACWLGQDAPEPGGLSVQSKFDDPEEDERGDVMPPTPPQ